MSAPFKSYGEIAVKLEVSKNEFKRCQPYQLCAYRVNNQYQFKTTVQMCSKSRSKNKAFKRKQQKKKQFFQFIEKQEKCKQKKQTR